MFHFKIYFGNPFHHIQLFHFFQIHPLSYSFKFIHLLAFSNCTLSQIVQLPLNSYIGSISQVHVCLTSSNHLTSPNSFIVQLSHVHPCLPSSNCLNSWNLITWVHLFSQGCPDPLTSSIISLLKISSMFQLSWVHPSFMHHPSFIKFPTSASSISPKKDQNISHHMHYAQPCFLWFQVLGWF